MIHCEGLYLQRGQRRILRDVTCTMPDARYTAIIGPNGAGKSSLLKCITGEWTPAAGNLTMHKRSLADRTALEAALERAIVPQRIDVAHGFSTLEYVVLGRYALHGGRERTTDIAAARYWLHEVGLENRVSADVATLSGGELQRAAFARACAQLDHDVTPWSKVLLLDESSSNLDLKHALGMARQCSTLARERGWCVVAVMHDLSTALRHADHVIVLADGMCIDEGKPAETMTSGTLSAVFDVSLAVRDGAVCVAS